MTREGAVEVNAATGKKKRISKRIRDADFAKTEAPPQPEQAAQPLPGGATSPPLTDTPPLPHAPGAEREQDTAAAERVLERIDGARTRKASKKAARKAQAEATAKEKSSRLQFTDEERATPELERYIRKSDKAADRLDAAKAAIPKEKKLVRERTFDEATGKGKTRLHFEEQEKPIGKNKPHNNPLSRPAQEAGIFVHNKIHSVEKDNALGKLSDEQFAFLTSGYDEEKKTLTRRIAELSQEIDNATERSADVKRFVALVRKYTAITELTYENVHEFIDRILIHELDKETNTRKIEIFYSFVGRVDTGDKPTESISYFRQIGADVKSYAI